MTLKLYVHLPGDMNSEQRIQEINKLSTLFDTSFLWQQYSRKRFMSKVSYILEVELTVFPHTPEQIAYLMQQGRTFTLTGIPDIECKVCEPTTGQIEAVRVEEEA